MHRTLSARWLNRALRIKDLPPSTSVPVFLCPAARSYGTSTGDVRRGVARSPRCAKAGLSQRRANHISAAPLTSEASFPEANVEVTEPEKSVVRPIRKLPLTCSGCGAFTQAENPDQLGYFNPESKRVRLWMRPKVPETKVGDTKEDKLVGDVLGALDKTKLEELGIDPALMMSGPGAQTGLEASQDKAPVCDRCHDLLHYSTTSSTAKVAMYHPTVESLRETIEESPHKYNHIYHVIDAADFPMSLIPHLNVLLGDIPIRTRNRRSRAAKFQKDRKTEISFIITRGDLLGPTKDIVDSMMPYLREVLREALGRLGGRVRLGNVKCVSAKRGWWTKTVKEDIWRRGGAGWMIGKVNVGKSQLFEAVYPKGRMTPPKASGSGSESAGLVGKFATGLTELIDDAKEEWKSLDVGDLLPPAQLETNYPEMPLVSSLPGTTASPIRVPFGGGKGELIDLPGLVRSDLELFVKEEHRQSLIMKKRIVPEQISLKHGKSLLLGGGLVRITPKTPDVVFLMYNFTPIDEHLTMNEKAIGFQDQTRQSIGIENISLPGIGDKMKHAGTFTLCHDVTKRRAGPLTRKNAVGLQADRLPFRVLSTDILIEGVGYVEIVAQVRARDVERWTRQQQQQQQQRQQDDEHEEQARRKDHVLVKEDPFAEMFNMRRENTAGKRRQLPTRAENEQPSAVKVDWPAVDVFTPEGRFVGSRRPINGWLNNKPRVLMEHKKSRPRRSMKGQKKQEKKEGRGTSVQESP